MRHLPLLWLSVTFLLGILLADAVNLAWGWWLLIALVLLAAGLAEARFLKRWSVIRRWKKISPFPFLLLLGIVGLGAARFQQSQPAFIPSNIPWYTQYEETVIHGVVNALPDVRPNAVLLRVKVDQAAFPGTDSTWDVNGNVLVRLPWNPDWQVGDQVVFSGRLDVPPQGQNFDYRNYLARQKVFTYMAYPQVLEVKPAEQSSILGGLWKIRIAAEDRLYRLLPMREAALLDGILLGNERNIPTDMEQDFRNTGTAHIIAISGFNIAIISALFTKLFLRLFSNRKRAFWVTLAAITLYTILVGAQPPVVRAAIMGSVGLVGGLIGRRQVGMNSLVFTAAVMTALTPALLWDASFQLSFCATMGLVLLADPISTWFETIVEKYTPKLQHSIITKAVSEYLLFTLAAQLTTLPVLAFHFRQFPLVGLLANPLILPPQPLVMILGGIMLIFSLIWFPLGQIFAWLAWPVTAYTIQMAGWLSKLGGQPIGLQAFNPLSLVVFYLLILLLVYRVRVSAFWKKIVLPSTILLLGALLVVSIWKPALERLDDRLHIIISTEGNAQTILLLDGNGTNWLIAGGKDSAVAIQELTQWQAAPVNHLSGVIWAAEDMDRKSAASISDRLPGKILAPESLLAAKNGLALYNQSTDWGANWQNLSLPGEITLHETMQVCISNYCDAGCAFLLKVDRFTLLVPGQNNLTAVVQWAQNFTTVPTVILLPEYDSQLTEALSEETFSPSLLIAVQVIPPIAGSNVIDLLDSGWVDIATNGSQLWVETEH